MIPLSRGKVGLQCTVPFSHAVSNTMTNKTKKKNAAKLRSEAVAVKRLSDQVKSLKMKKNTPFADTGGIAGQKIGSMFGNAAWGKSIGRWLGTGIGSIFGSGDYTMVGSIPNYNVLTNSKQIPQFTSSQQTNIVCHREYLGDILGTASFSNTAYPLNPGMAQTFPWLSTVAENYQEYKFHGVVFEFRPLITDFVTNGAPGVVVMATNYNADVPAYVNKQQMENSEYAVSVKPTNALMHGVECQSTQTTLPQRYVRNGSVPSNQDLRLYDYGNFQFATQSNPVQNLGELWVSYCVEFFKPVLPATVGGSISSAHVYRTGVLNTLPLGSATVTNTGTLALTVAASSIQFLAAPSTKYLVNLTWNGPSGAVTFPGLSVSGAGILTTFWNNNANSSIAAPSVGATTTQSAVESLYLVGTTGGGNAIIAYNTSGIFPAGWTVDIIVVELDSSIS